MSDAPQQVIELVENFSLFDDWEDRYRYLIDLGKTLPAMDFSLKNEQNLVRGCTAQVWMVSGWSADSSDMIISQNFDKSNGVYRFYADSDAHIVRGLIAILMRLYQGRSADEIRSIDIHDLFEQLGLAQNLSPNRRNGFFSMVERIQRDCAI